MMKRPTLTGSSPRHNEEEMAIAHAPWPLHETGRIKLRLFAAFPLPETNHAHRLVASSGSIGKIVVPDLLRSLWLAAALLTPQSALADFNSGLVALLNKDYPKAFNHFKPLAVAGNAAAQVNMGNLFMKGLGVEQNYRTAMGWYKSAAEQGERMAQNKLGILYFYGLGTEKDSVEAAKWFAKAAAQGDTSAQTVLGSLYASGEGVPKDLAHAFYWLTMAEEQGDTEATKARKSLEEDLTPGQRDEALRLMSEARKAKIEQEEQAFAEATAKLPPPPDKAGDGHGNPASIKSTSPSNGGPSPISAEKPKPRHKPKTRTGTPDAAVKPL